MIILLVCAFSKYDDPRLTLMDTAYDGIHKEGFLQEGLGALTDTLVNRHIQLYPGGITNGTSSIKTENHVFTFFPASGWVGWGGVSSISLSFTLTSKCLLRGVSLVTASQQALGIGVGLLSSAGSLINSCAASLLGKAPLSYQCNRSVVRSADGE